MTQKTNGPDSNNSDDFTASDFSIRFIKLSQNEGIVLGHKYQRQIMNSETQIRTTLTTVHYRQAPGKVIQVERINQPGVTTGETWTNIVSQQVQGTSIRWLPGTCGSISLILTRNVKSQHHLLPFHS